MSDDTNGAVTDKLDIKTLKSPRRRGRPHPDCEVCNGRRKRQAAAQRARRAKEKGESTLFASAQGQIEERSDTALPQAQHLPDTNKTSQSNDQ